MIRPYSRWALGALALAGVATFAQGAGAKEIVRRHHVQHHSGVYVQRNSQEFMAIGASVPDPGGDHYYYDDARGPNYYLGPTIFQRFDF